MHHLLVQNMGEQMACGFDLTSKRAREYRYSLASEKACAIFLILLLPNIGF